MHAGTERKYHKYYQWVGFMLIMLAVAFYIPRYIWKTYEGGLVRTLVSNLDDPLLDAEVKMDRLTRIIKYFKEHRGMHGFYALT